ncbi:VOC family protein [Salipaludibacillus sp. CF4.18]|uniref:VOC family protein n=1 Tax=Salipaludibacillus sp. CF4.18 TaxID=3373081 RepID=UPI003EE788A2
MIDIIGLHHVSLCVTDLAKAKEFYGEVLGFAELQRPDFDFSGAWYSLGDQQLHLIVYRESNTLRKENNINSRDGHFAIRVRDYHQTLSSLKYKGVQVVEKPKSKSGFAQIFCMDPDHNLIEFNVEQKDVDE